MLTKRQRIIRFAKSTILKILIFALTLGLIGYVVNFLTFANNMAMAQFENDNFSYAAWDAFVNARNLFNSYYDLIICIFAGTIIYDISTFIKINKGEN